MTRTAVLFALAVAAPLAVVARAQDKPRSVTFVNDSQKDVNVHVRTGSSGEQGTCEAKSSQNTFELRGGEKKEVDAEGSTVCWCSRPASEGPINERRDCAQMDRAVAGSEVHVR